MRQKSHRLPLSAPRVVTTCRGSGESYSKCVLCVRYVIFCPGFDTDHFHPSCIKTRVRNSQIKVTRALVIEYSDDYVYAVTSFIDMIHSAVRRRSLKLQLSNKFSRKV